MQTCARCGYWLDGLEPDRSCPECGATLPDRTSHERARDARRWVWILILVMLLPVVGVGVYLLSLGVGVVRHYSG